MIVTVASGGLVVVRCSRIGAAAMIVWFILLESFGLAALTQHQYGSGVFLMVVWWPLLVPMILTLRDEVRIDGDWLIAHGWFRERRWTRTDLCGMEEVRERWSPNMAYLRLETTNGRAVRLPGTTGSAWSRAARRRGTQRDTLARWLQRGAG